MPAHTLAQTGFNQLPDATGFADNIPQHTLDSLESASQSLREAMPQEFQNDFAVYELGFYSHHRSFTGGIPDVLATAIDSRISSSYYLLFGREFNADGDLEKVWIELELPHTADFCYWEEGTLSHLKFMTELRANEAKGNSGIFTIFTSMKDAIDYMEGRVAQLVDCCGAASREECGLCSWSQSDIEAYFEHGGASFREITISDPVPPIDTTCICDTDFTHSFSDLSGSTYLIESYTSINSFELDSVQFDVQELMDSLAWLGAVYEANGISFYAVITDNSVFCGDEGALSLRSGQANNLKAILHRYLSKDVGVWLHFDHTLTEGTSLILKTNGVGGNVLVDINSCNNNPVNCEKLNCTLDRLQSNDNGFFSSTIVNGFCKGSKFDLVFRLRVMTHPATASTLSEVLKSRIVTINLNPNFIFKNDKFCDLNVRGYLRLATYILHESVHALFARKAGELSGTFSTSSERRKNLTFLGYNIKYLQNLEHAYEHGPISDTINERNSAVIWTEHHYIFYDFFNPIVEDLYIFNDNYLERKHYYYSIIWIDQDHWPPGYNVKGATGIAPYDLYKYRKLLKNKPKFPCCEN